MTGISDDEIAALHLAAAEAAECRDGWMTAGDAADSPCPPQVLIDKHEQGIGRLSERFPNLEIMLHTSSKYPGALSSSAHGSAPTILFASSPLGDLGGSVAVVGPRRATSEARAAAREIAAGVSKAGRVVVSGLAKGVDTAAHVAALNAGGRTIAVLGTGLEQVFPLENERLFADIEKQGALVSQFPPGAPPSKTSFPARNMVIAGLSAASVIVDASPSSGTRIEMDWAMLLGRTVMFWGPVAGRQEWVQQLAHKNSQMHIVSSVDQLIGLTPC